MTDSPEESRIWQIVGGRFTSDSIGPDDYNRIVETVRREPQRHIAAFERLFFSGRPSARNLVELDLASFLAVVSPAAPAEAGRLARRLEGLMDSLVRAHESEAAGAPGRARGEEIDRRRSRIDMHRQNLTQFRRG